MHSASPCSLRRLIVNADDLALTAGVNRAVAELSQAHALTSATLMAHGAAFDDAVRAAQSHPGLGVGCHVVLVDGQCVAPPAEIPSLLEKDASLSSSLVRFAARLHTGAVLEKHIETEAVSQIRRLQSAGITVTHVDTHKHTHLFPRVARPLIRAALQCGVPAIRNPFEEPWSASLTRGSLLRKLEVAALRSFRTTFRKLLRASGMKTTDGCIGVSATGSLDAETLRSLLENMPPGIWELVCHPGYNDSDLATVRTRLRATRDVERNALLQQIPQAAHSGHIELIGFRDL